MPPTTDGFLEGKDYTATIYADPGFAPRDPPTGGWWAWVKFERKVDFGPGTVSIPAFRHQVPGALSTKSDAVDAAYDYARRTMENGDVGL